MTSSEEAVVSDAGAEEEVVLHSSRGQNRLNFVSGLTPDSMVADSVRVAVAED